MLRLPGTIPLGVAILAFTASAALGSPEKSQAAKAPDAKPAKAHLARVGGPAPDFELTDTEGNVHRLSAYTKEGKTVVLEWFNPDCPFVKKHHQKHKTMHSTWEEFAGKSTVWLAINSGGPGKQGNGVERNVKAREDYGIEYPVLLDESGKVGRLYQAKTTPHMFVIDGDGTLVYAGAIDDNRSPTKLGKTNYVAGCLAALVAGEEIETGTTKPYGCSVKYASKGAQLP